MTKWEPPDAALKDACAPRLLIEARTPVLIAVFIAITCVLCGSALGQGTVFTYQGKLADLGTPANGNYDFEFKLFDTATVGTGSQQGSTIQRLNVAVASGAFNVSLDFGACASCFTGADRFLEISVKPTSGSTFTTLSPRQPISATPYALKSLNAGAADALSLMCVSCVTSGQIGGVNGSVVTGAIPVGSVPSASAFYVQNTTTQQATSNFNISGTGAANIIDAATQFNISGNRMLSIGGFSSTFAGIGAGLSTTGDGNSFFGYNAGRNNTGGDTNSFFGSNAGASNTNGFSNSFFGIGSGFNNISGNSNAFFGEHTGFSNNSFSNSFFGAAAGFHNTAGSGNSFFGSSTGINNTTGFSNSFFGTAAGLDNAEGEGNTLIGMGADFASTNTTGDKNTSLGNFSKVAANLNNATAIGARALVTQSNSLVLGSINGINGADADTSVGIGTTAPAAPLHIVSGASGTSPNANASLIVDSSAGHFVNILGPDNGQFGILFGKPSGGGSVAGIVFNNPSIPDGLQFRTGGSTSTRLSITSAGDVGIGTGVPADKLHVIGIIRVSSLGAAGSTSLCRNSSDQIATCSSSLRYKTDVLPFISGLEVITRLSPISFTWKQSGIRDIGFGAEEVARVAPLFTFTNDKGEIEGVKYDRITVLLVNAIKQQQQEIEERERKAAIQEEQIKLLNAESSEMKKRLLQIKPLEEAVLNLKRVVCIDHPTAEVCK